MIKSALYYPQFHTQARTQLRLDLPRQLNFDLSSDQQSSGNAVDDLNALKLTLDAKELNMVSV